MNWQQQIVIDPAVSSGKPTLRRSNILLQPLVDSLLNGTSVGKLRAEHPALSEDEIIATIAYTRMQVIDRKPTGKQQFAMLTEFIGLLCFAFGYGLSLSTLFTYEILIFLGIATLVSWLSSRFQLLDYTGKISSLRIKPVAMIGAAAIGFALRTFFFEVPFVPALLLGATLLSVSELSNENRYIRWLSFGKEINIILMIIPILLMVLLVSLRLWGGAVLNIYESLLLLGYSLMGGLITALTYRRFINTHIDGDDHNSLNKLHQA